MHPQAIPFENLDPFLHRPVPLDLPALEAKLVHGRRGGYCFEQNLLFARVLEELGFRVTGLAARVLWNRPEGAVTPRSHMLLRVDMTDGPWLCDVGFGVLTPTAPLKLVPHEEQPTPHETFRLSPLEEGFRLEALVGGTWKAIYRFTLETAFHCDHELSNYYLSTSDASHFRHTLIAARPAEDGRDTLRDTRVTHYPHHGSPTELDLVTVDDIAAALATRFDIVVPDRAALNRAAKRESFF